MLKKPTGNAVCPTKPPLSMERPQQHLRWYVVRTLPRRETGAKAQLENQGYRVFMPNRLKTIRHARKFRTALSPLFPQYLFIELDLAVHRWRSVNGTLGVSGLVMSRELPQPVPPGIVEAMLVAADRRGLLRVDQSLKAGERVRLTAGAFAEQLGILINMDDSTRVRVLLEMMGGKIDVEIPRDFVTTAA